MKADWKRLPFLEAVTDVSGGNLKSLQSDYLLEGRFPVVDQGKPLIAGYLNDESRLCQVSLPVIVFGDHTRHFKFIDFPFCIGADGVKVLRPKGEIDEKYLYHYLRYLRLPEGGYDRHFKYLKRSEVLVPPLAEQRRIAEVLDRAEALRDMRREAIAQFDALTQAIFHKMFNDPKTNPKGWPVCDLGSLFAAPPIFGTMTPPTAEERPWLSLRVANIQNWQLDLSDKKFVVLPENTVERHSVKDGDLLLARAIASLDHLGKCIVAYPGVRKWAFDSHLMRLRFDPQRAEPEFIRQMFMTSGGRQLFLSASRKSTVQFNINTKEISSIHIPVPPIALQREYVQRIFAVEKMKAAQLASLTELDALFATLRHRAFRGEL